jgi:peptidoglycan/LPS O-acetylase OafA/YrhL
MSNRYRADIDGLRAISIIGVIVYHLDKSILPGGFAGVDVFFVVSGYLITKILLEDYINGKFNIINFWVRRSLRLLPAMYLMLVVTSIISFLIYRPAELVIFSKAGISTILYYSNIYFARNVNYFDPELDSHPLIHTWSLSVEEQFYFIAPILVIISIRNKFNKNILYIVILLSAISLLFNFLWPFKNTVAQFYLLPTRGWELCVGAICAIVLRDFEIEKFRMVFSIIRFFALLIIILFFVLYNQIDYYPNFLTLIPVAATSIILLEMKNDFTEKFLSFKLLVKIGLMSYSLYLWHNPIFAFSNQFEKLYISNITIKNILMVVLTLIISFYSWKYIELPSRNGANKRLKISLITLTFVILIIYFLLTIMTHGFINRYPVKSKEIASLNFSEEGKFVEERFKILSNNEFFSKSDKRKILLVGDSFAQDLINIVENSSANEKIEVLTLYISARCGNLVLPFEKFSNKISLTDHKYCPAESALVNNERFRLLAPNANEIWFASAWSEWQSDLIGESLKFLKNNITDARIVVFGKKDLGKVDLRVLLKMDPEKMIKMQGSESLNNLKINKSLQENVQKYGEYFDIQAIACHGDNGLCRLFNDNGNLISYDGHHLTKSGAILIGSRFTLN